MKKVILQSIEAFLLHLPEFFCAFIFGYTPKSFCLFRQYVRSILPQHFGAKPKRNHQNPIRKFTTGMPLILCSLLLINFNHLSANDASHEKRIAVCTQSTKTAYFWEILYDGMSVAAQEKGIKIDFYGLYDPDVRNMPKYIEEAISKKPDGLIISIPYPKLLEEPIRKAIEKGIDVVAINAGFDEFARLGIKTFVGEDSYQAGQAAGLRILKAGVNKLICIRDDEPDVSINRRIQGIHDVFEKENKSLLIHSVKNKFSPATASAAISTAFIIDKTIDGVMALGATSAILAINALKEQELYGKIPFATFDVTPIIVDAIKSGKILFGVSQQPFMQGYVSVSLLASLKGTDVRTIFYALNQLFKPHNFFPPGTMPFESYQNPGSIIYTGPIFITPETVNQPNLQY